MVETFDRQLDKVKGKIRRINAGDLFERKHNGLLNYWNRAEDLHKAALVIHDSDQMLFRVFPMLIGLSIELLLKGILLGLQEKFPLHHKLLDLSNCAGIEILDDDNILLNSLTQHVYWASKYPAPKDKTEWNDAWKIFDRQRRPSGNLAQLDIQARSINRDNYLRLWELFSGFYWKVHEAVLESAD